MSKIIGLAAALVLMIAAPAAAQTSPTQDAYGGSAGEVAGISPGGAAPSSGVAGISENGTAPSSGVAGISESGTAPDSGAGVDRTPAGAGGVRGVREGGGSAPSSGDARPSVGAPVSQPLATTGKLPFTGLDVGFLAAGSLVLVGLGFLLRRLGRPSTPLV